MTQQALGLIEAVGLPVAIEAADAALKAANVILIGYEKTRGGGLIVVKLRGDVGAVKAAVEAGVASASRVGKIFSWHIIPHPHENTEQIIGQVDRGPARPLTIEQAAPAPPVVETPAPPPVKILAPPPVETPALPPVKTPAPPPVETPAPPPVEILAPPAVETLATCNLCNDPACRRQPGQLHRLCIHFKR